MKYKTQLKLHLPVLVFFFFVSSFLSAQTYLGDTLLRLLGSHTDSKEFTTAQKTWLLNLRMESELKGIKLSTDNITGKIQSILLAGENCKINGARFYKYTAPLPFGILITDDTASLRKKLGEGQRLPDSNILKFYKKDVAIEVAYNYLQNGKISSVRFYHQTKHAPEPVKVVAETKKAEVPKLKLKEPSAESPLKKPIKTPVLIAAPVELPIEPEKKIIEIPEPVVQKKDLTGLSFKSALLSVFETYRESNFSSIKGSVRKGGNFWNYKFTYNTKLKIPGEKYNLLYCFPFPHSPIDFVSVIKEADSYDASFVTVYKELEKKLLRDFPPSEGWTASCIKNSESAVLSDLEFSNDRYGAIVLDYSKNPKGRHILYIRFLLYSN